MTRFVPSPTQAVVALGAGLLVGALGILPRPVLELRWETRELHQGSYVPHARRDPGEELVFVVIGSSGCAWSNLPETASLVREARDSVRSQADALQLGFATLGVAKDINPERGIRHLKRFGALDEIMTGRAWLNSGVRRYIYHDFPGPAVTPQVLVVTRTIERSGGQWEVVGERIIVRKAGLVEIRRWIGGGARLSAAWTPASTG